MTRSPIVRSSRSSISRDKVVEVEPLGLQRLAAGEGEQLAGQRGGVGSGLDDRLGEADALVVGKLGRAEHVGRALDDGQQIVEVVGDAAGQLAQRLHLLALAELVFGFGALLDLLLEQDVGLGERLGAAGELAVGGTELRWLRPRLATTSAASTNRPSRVA